MGFVHGLSNMGGGSSRKESTEGLENQTGDAPKEKQSVLDDDSFGEAPNFLVCPITQEVMEDPVFTSDGHTFERSAIESWLSNNCTNPMTGSEMPDKNLTPNFAIREACDAYRSKTSDNAESIRRYNTAISQISSPSQSGQSTVSSSVSSGTSFFSSLPGKSEIKTATSMSQSAPAVDMPSIRRVTSSGSTSSGTNFSSGTSSNIQQTMVTSPNSSSRGLGSPPLCSLCPNQAKSKSKVGDDWLVVCESCKVLVSQQQSMESNAGSRKSFRALSAMEAGEDLEFGCQDGKEPLTVEARGQNSSPYIVESRENYTNVCSRCNVRQASTRGNLINLGWVPLCAECDNSTVKRQHSNFRPVPLASQQIIEFRTD